MGSASDRSGGPRDDASLPPGTIVVQATGLNPDALASTRAALLALQREGDDVQTHNLGDVPIDAAGTARFQQVRQPPGAVLRVTVDHEKVRYASAFFKLRSDAGKRVPIQLFEVTEDMDRALVGVQAFVYLEPRDHHLQVEQMFRFANLSEETWRAEPLFVRLPASAKGLANSGEPGVLSLRAVPGSGVVLDGFVPPGSSEVGFQYHVPYPNDETMRLEFGMPPRVGAARIMASMAPRLGLHIDGFDPPVPSRNDDGQRMLVAQREVPAGGDQLERLRMTLHGLPSGRTGPWIALLLTALAMAGGIAGAVYLRRSPGKHHGQDNCRERILRALSKLESLHAQHRIGEDQYAVERDLWIAELARCLEASETHPGDDGGGDKDGDKP